VMSGDQEDKAGRHNWLIGEAAGMYLYLRIQIMWMVLHSKIDEW
jgi:hypothetical protein